MGSGIAQVFASHRFKVLLYDVSEEAVGRAKLLLAAQLDKLVEKNKITASERERTIANLQYSTNPDDCLGDLVVEAVVENLDIKCNLINHLLAINSNNTIITTNTSSLSLTSIASKITSPSRFAGMHFFNPAPLMKLVEIVRTSFVADDLIASLAGVATALGKTPVICNDSPGFIVNRVARPYYLEALYLAETTNTPLEDIDRLMEASGFPMGPFRLMDLIGNDVNFSVTNIVYDALHQPERLKPSPIQALKVTEGMLGRKSGKGFYDYA